MYIIQYKKEKETREMKSQELRNVLEKADNRFEILSNPQIFNQYEMNRNQFLGLIKDFLSDEEKENLFDYSHFQKMDIKEDIMKMVSDEKIQLRMLDNDSITGEWKKYKILRFVKGFPDNVKDRC